MGAAKTMITADQLLEMPRQPRMELVKGELVEMSPIGGEHGYLASRLWRLLDAFNAKHNLGFLAPEVGYILSRDPDTVRAPDLAFVSSARLPEPRRRGYLDVAPDLAIEILSPGDRPGQTLHKVAEYLNAGVRLVWIIDPEGKEVTSYRANGRTRVYSGDDEVPGEDVLPEFSFKPSHLFS